MPCETGAVKLRLFSGVATQRVLIPMGALVDLLISMGLVIVTWIGAVGTFYGIGFLVERAIGLAPASPFPFARGWLGICAVLAILQWIHFFSPIAFWVAPVLLVIGLAALLLTLAPPQHSGLRTRDSVRHSLFTIHNSLLLLALVWLANRATGQWLPYDTGFYHASTLEWFVQYPVVPGLANLHGPLALNSVHLLLAAAVDSGFFVRSSHHLVCGIWIVMALAWFLASLRHAKQSA